MDSLSFVIAGLVPAKSSSALIYTGTPVRKSKSQPSSAWVTCST